LVKHMILYVQYINSIYEQQVKSFGPLS
jgi:hypothetical protein